MSVKLNWKRLFVAPVMAPLMALSVASSVRAEPATVPAADESLATLRAFSEGSTALYRRIEPSLIWVKLETGADGLFPRHVRKEYEKWREGRIKQGPLPGGRPGAIRIGPANKDAGSDSTPTTAPTPEARNPLTELYLAREFFQQHLGKGDGENNPVVNAISQRIMAMRMGQQDEAIGVVVDANHAMVLVPLFADENKTLTFRTVDGRTGTAKTLPRGGAKFFNNLELLNPELVKPAPISKEHPDPGSLLMWIGAQQGATGWMTAAAPQPGESRFPITGPDNRGVTYLFDLNGSLVAVGFEHFAAPIADMKNWGHRRPEFGIRFSFLGPNAPLRAQNRALGDRPAVHVDAVQPGSLAEQAGVKKDDIILSINGISVVQWKEIMEDRATKPPEPTRIGILRGPEEQTLIICPPEGNDAPSRASTEPSTANPPLPPPPPQSPRPQ